MSLWFLLALALAVTAAYCYPRSSNELAYLWAFSGIVAAAIALCIAPWELQLALAVGAIAALPISLGQRLWTAHELLEADPEILARREAWQSNTTTQATSATPPAPVAPETAQAYQRDRSALTGWLGRKAWPTDHQPVQPDQPVQPVPATNSPPAPTANRSPAVDDSDLLIYRGEVWHRNNSRNLNSAVVKGLPPTFQPEHQAERQPESIEANITPANNGQRSEFSAGPGLGQALGLGLGQTLKARAGLLTRPIGR